VTRLWVLHLDDKTAHPVTDGLTNDWASGWSSDGRNLYFVSSRGGTMDLWQQPMDSDGTPSGTPHRLTTGVGMRQAQLSPDGSKLAYSRGRRIANLWRLPILAGRTATWADAEQLTFDQALVEHFDVSGDGERLLVSSDRGGNPDIWMMPSSGGEMQQLTATPTPDWAPAWSPDGKEFAFYSFRSGNRDVWTMALDGGPARQITRNDATDWYPDWSPDGREIVFWSERSGNGDIWSIAATGGEAVQITRHPTDDIHPQWGATGGWLMFTSNRDDHNRLWRVPVAGGTPEALTAGPARMGRLSSDGREVFFIGWAERAGEIWSVSVQDGFERQVTSFAGRQGTLGANALAVDSRYLYFSWEQDLGDLWVMDVVISETRV
jgi:TolB protein